jgi:hypothetical protein
MFRPEERDMALVAELVGQAESLYRLDMMILTWDWKSPSGKWGTVEFWLCDPRPDVAALMQSLRDATFAGEVDSPVWHTLRARLTGVPARETDVLFHERDGAA